jgi:hypothetical protein
MPYRECGRTPPASTWLFVEEEVKEKILEQKFPCVMSGWTTGLSGLWA